MISAVTLLIGCHRYQAEGTEFRDLCYMLTCKSVQDVPAFKVCSLFVVAGTSDPVAVQEWDVASGRQLLCDQFSLMNNLDAQQESTDGHGSGHKVPTGRSRYRMSHQLLTASVPQAGVYAAAGCRIPNRIQSVRKQWLRCDSQLAAEC